MSKLKDVMEKDVSIKKKVERKNPVVTKNIEDITLEDIKLHPEKFIEINIVNRNEIIESQYVFAEHETFKINDKTYRINHKKKLHKPKGEYIIPALFYIEGYENPIDFKNKNIGIPAKILSLLFDSRLYRMLIHPEDYSLNWVLIIIYIIIICLISVVIYLLYNNGYFIF